MLKNIIFDMGNVLIYWRPAEYVKKVGVSEEDAALLKREVFDSEEWGFMDSGRMVEEEAYESISLRIPEHLKKIVHDLVCDWDKIFLEEIPGMEELCGELKGMGYGIYLLSNASSRQHEYWKRIRASQYFDGTLISADVKMVKPNAEIYEELYKKFDLDPQECIFIDDNEANVSAAIKTGMRAIVFKEGPDEVRAAIENAEKRKPYERSFKTHRSK